MIRIATTEMSSRVVLPPSGLPSAGKAETIAALPAAVCTATVTM